MPRYTDFKSFYPYYLSEHGRTGTRVLHFIGTTVFLCSIPMAFLRGKAWLPGFGAACAYALAWTGHFFVEKNRPATFRQPVYSLLADFVFYFEVITGREKLIR